MPRWPNCSVVDWVGKGHKVEVATDGIKGLEKSQTLPFDVIVLDVMLPGMDGLHVARRLRAGGVRVPILMLTARDSVPDIVRGLDGGADDYLTKPFSFEVLAARLRVIGRRAASESDRVLQVADLSLNTETHEVSSREEAVGPHSQSSSSSKHLVRPAGRLVSRDDLTEAVWELIGMSKVRHGPT
jgi:two-component system, OmpR family, response regulator